MRRAWLTGLFRTARIHCATRTRPRSSSTFSRTLALALPFVLLACSPSSEQQAKTGTQTNWLKQCTLSSECGELDCHCGVCTSSCESNAQCSDLASAVCFAPSEPGSLAWCGEQMTQSSLCLPACDDESCGADQSCSSGACVTPEDPTPRISIDSTIRYQTLLGFGSSLAYAEDEIVSHPQKVRLFDVMFSDSGFDIIRLRNRFDANNQDELMAASEIVAAASDRLGRTPTLFMTSGSPPATLKANASRRCAGNSDTCTLAQPMLGTFDYAGLAEHWRASLEAHAAVGLVPDYLSIQNGPNWVPDSSTPMEACRFLPQEGVTAVMLDGVPTDVTYPGYEQALTAVRAALESLPNAPKVVAPEATSLELVEQYTASLPSSSYDGLAYHLYGTEAATIDPEPFERLRALAEASGHAVFQTEMQADGFDTAVLTHYSMTAANATVYLQNDFVASASADSSDPFSLLALTEEDFESQGPYHALRHYARHTDPGWQRVSASSESAQVLSSGWISPDEDALTVVLVNPSTDEVDLVVDLSNELRLQLVNSAVERTVFDGTEQSAALGALPSDNKLTLPSRSIVTEALTR